MFALILATWIFIRPAHGSASLSGQPTLQGGKQVMRIKTRLIYRGETRRRSAKGRQGVWGKGTGVLEAGSVCLCLVDGTRLQCNREVASSPNCVLDGSQLTDNPHPAQAALTETGYLSQSVKSINCILSQTTDGLCWSNMIPKDCAAVCSIYS